uniref:Thioredoxin domain-containing protein n=1 Tax=Timspurckia oligopyrenoides TaxID=708627 RepID=A0A7S1ESX1_9RHOD|mmetsp:Transcript_5434/g.9583  ORF Transcript_5434/g.9583 Transcript_5434/m.9583 type:complete len:741 (+) Transcript_5434:63-2285(+)
MSLFRRTEQSIDTFEQLLKTCSDASQSDSHRVECYAQSSSILAQLSATLSEFTRKAQLGLNNPSQKLYGDSMCNRIFEAHSKLKKQEEIYETIKDEMEMLKKELEKEKMKKYEEDMAEMKRKEEEAERMRKAQEERENERKKEQERMEEEEKKKKEEEEERVREKVRKFRENRLKKEEEKKNAAAMKSKGMKLSVDPKAKQVQIKPKEEKAGRNAAVEQVSGVKEMVKVRTAMGDTMEIMIEMSASVEKLKLEIMEKLGGEKYSKENLILSYAGKIVSDLNSTIESHGIVPGATIYCVVAKDNDDESTPAAASNSETEQQNSQTKTESASIPSGSVCHLSDGAAELNLILSSIKESESSDRAVVVDYSAPWCGPCRAIEPLYEQLAAEFPDVSLIHINTELNPANAQLARTAAVRAYPTFHVYQNYAIVETITGANPQKLRSTVASYSTSVQGGSSSSSSVAASGESLQSRVMKALVVLKTGCASNDEFVQASNTLLMYVKNVAENPTEVKYRRIRWNNAGFQNRLASKTGGVECLKAFGFEDTVDSSNNNERVLLLSESAANNRELPNVCRHLEQALKQFNGQSSAPAAVASGSSLAGASGSGGGSPSPVQGGVGGGNRMVDAMMADPQMSAMAQELMGDPSAMAQLMEAQRAMQNGDGAALARLRESPVFARLANTMMGNPELMQRMGNAANTNGGMENTGGENQEMDDEEERMLQQALQMSLEEFNENQEGEQKKQE